jgi:hypothetical protein
MDYAARVGDRRLYGRRDPEYPGPDSEPEQKPAATAELSQPMHTVPFLPAP